MRFSGKKKEAFLVHAPSYILEKGCAQEKWHRFRFSRPSVNLLSEIKDRGRGGSNRDTVFRHGDHGESSTCSRKGPTRSAFESNLVDFFPIQVQVYSRLLSEIMFISRETELNGSRGDFVIGIMRGWRRACLEIHDESYVAFSLITRTTQSRENLNRYWMIGDDKLTWLSSSQNVHETIS